MTIIVLDRDGVVNREVEGGCRSAGDWTPLPGSIEAMTELTRAGYQLVIATNQPGLARGWFDLDDLEAMHAKMRALVEDAGGEVAGIFYCPHDADDNCRCRKPATGLLDVIEAEFDTSLHDCYFVGDRLRDLQAAVAKGCKPVLVRTGHGEKTVLELISNPDESLSQTAVFDDLGHFSKFIMQ